MSGTGLEICALQKINLNVLKGAVCYRVADETSSLIEHVQTWGMIDGTSPQATRFTSRGSRQRSTVDSINGNLTKGKHEQGKTCADIAIFVAVLNDGSNNLSDKGITIKEWVYDVEGVEVGVDKTLHGVKRET